MRKLHRSTRRGWMIFTEADKGGKGGGAAVAEPPPDKPHAGDATSKSIFNQARVDVGLDNPKDEPPPPAKTEDAPPAKTDDAPPPAKPEKKTGTVPEDVLDPSKSAAPKVHDAVAEIQSAELPKGAKKEQIDSFGKLKEKAAKHLQAALDRAAELEKQAAAATNKDEVAALQKRAQEAEEKARTIEEEWSKVAFKESPKFKAQFAAREQTALDLAKTYLDGTEVKPDIVDLAAHATGRKRVELLKDAGIDDTVITAILPHLANFDTVQREKQNALANWKTESKQWQEEAQQQSEKVKAARVEQENKVWDGVVTKARSEILPLRESKENPEWNARAQQLIEEAKKLYNGDGADLPTFAETILRGVTSRAQDEVIDHLKGEVANLRAENAKLKSASPGGVITGGTNDGAQIDQSKMSREEVAKSTFNAEKAKAAAG